MVKGITKALGVCGAVLLVTALSGCASIMSGSEQRIDFRSDPSDASIKVYDSGGMVVASSQTPSSVLLKKGQGFFQGANYRVAVEKPGYKKVEVLLRSSLNAGWYLFGNFFIGGFIGWLIVDPATGAMWTLSPEQVSAELAREVSFLQQDDGLMILLLADVPPEVRPVLEQVVTTDLRS